MKRLLGKIRRLAALIRERRKGMPEIHIIGSMELTDGREVVDVEYEIVEL